MPIEIVRCTAQDPRFAELVAQLDDDMTARYGAVQALYRPHNATEGVSTAVLALDGAWPVGCGCFKPHGPGAAELKRIYVPESARRRGIAVRIVKALEDWARELGFARVVLETGTLQTEAIALYERLGYERIPPFGPYGDLPASVCFAKSLGGQARG